MISFRVPGVPVPAPRPRVTKHGAYFSERYENYKAAVAAAALEATGGKTYQWCDVILTIEFVGAWRNSDLDNLWKGPQDALTGILWARDSVDTITEVHASWRASDRCCQPCTEITVEPIASRNAGGE